MLFHLVSLFVSSVAAQNPFHATAEVAAVRTYFYFGGGYSDDGKGGHIFKDQMYMEKLEPAYPPANNSDPIVLVHGQAQTGTNF